MKTVKKSLVALYLDGEFAVYIDSYIINHSGYKLGEEISDEELRNLIYDSDIRRAKRIAFYYLEKRDYSKKELLDKINKDVSYKAAQEIVEYVENLGFIDDKKYAEKYALELFEVKGYAKSRVEFELKTKGIDRDIIEEIVDEISIEPREQIKYLINKKFPNLLESEKAKMRAINTLKRYGHSWEDIKSVLEEIKISF